MENANTDADTSTFHFRRGKYHGIAFQIIGYVMLLVGAGRLIFSPGWMVIVILALGLYLAFASEVVLINLTANTLKEGASLFGWHMAKSKPLPTIEYVSIFPTRMAQSTTTYYSASKQTTLSQEVRVNLIHSRNQRLHVFTSSDREGLLKVAHKFAAHLNVGIYDCTGDENRWIKEKPAL